MALMGPDVGELIDNGWEGRALREAVDLIGYHPPDSYLRMTREGSAVKDLQRIEASVESALRVIEESLYPNKEGLKGLLTNHEIRTINSQIRDGSFVPALKEAWNLTDDEIGDVEGIQMRNSSKCWNAFCCLTCLPRGVCSVLSDLVTLAIGGCLTCCYWSKRQEYYTLEEEIVLGETPIMMAHGSSFNWTEFVPLIQYLKRKGYHNIFAFNPEPWTPCRTDELMEVYAERFESRVDEVLELTGCRKVIVIGHSLGGSVAINAAEHNKVAAVISVSTPFLGSNLVDIIARKRICCKSCCIPRLCCKGVPHVTQWSTTSPQLEELRERMLGVQREGLARVYCYYSSMDGVMEGKWNSGRLPFSHPARTEQSWIAGHNSVIINPDLFRTLGNKWLPDIQRWMAS